MSLPLNVFLLAPSDLVLCCFKLCKKKRLFCCFLLVPKSSIKTCCLWSQNSVSIIGAPRCLLPGVNISLHVALSSIVEFENFHTLHCDSPFEIDSNIVYRNKATFEISERVLHELYQHVMLWKDYLTVVEYSVSLSEARKYGLIVTLNVLIPLNHWSTSLSRGKSKDISYILETLKLYLL